MSLSHYPRALMRKCHQLLMFNPPNGVLPHMELMQTHVSTITHSNESFIMCLFPPPSRILHHGVFCPSHVTPLMLVSPLPILKLATTYPCPTLENDNPSSLGIFPLHFLLIWCVQLGYIRISSIALQYGPIHLLISNCGLFWRLIGRLIIDKCIELRVGIPMYLD